MFETLSYDVADGIATIMLNRPDRLNAFNATMAAELVEAFDMSDADDAVRVVIFTGAGRAFCAGADLQGGADTFNYSSQDRAGPVGSDGTIDWSHPAVRDNGGKVTLRIFESLKPVIAAINGPAVGIGITMTLAMDVRMIADGAKIGFVFARRGIVSEAGSSFFLPRIVGIQNALEWCMSGRIMPAAEVHAGGLTRSIHAAEDLLPAATALAREIADNTAPVSVALIRQMMWRGLGMAHPMEAHRIDSRGVYARGRSADAVEGINSFLEKRPAVYADKVSSGMPGFFPWWQGPDWA